MLVQSCWNISVSIYNPRFLEKLLLDCWRVTTYISNPPRSCLQWLAIPSRRGIRQVCSTCLVANLAGTWENISEYLSDDAKGGGNVLACRRRKRALRSCNNHPDSHIGCPLYAYILGRELWIQNSLDFAVSQLLQYAEVNVSRPRRSVNLEIPPALYLDRRNWYK